MAPGYLTAFWEGAAGDEVAPLENQPHAARVALPVPTAASSVPLPFLRLQGRWLDQAGFAIGAQVRVQVMPRRLVLEVIETERTVEHDLKRARQSTAG